MDTEPSSSSKAMETKLISVEKFVGELGEIRLMLGEILQKLTITSETHKELAKIAPNNRNQIQERQHLGNDMAANINFPLNEGRKLARNLGNHKIAEDPYQELQMNIEHNPRTLYQARF